MTSDDILNERLLRIDELTRLGGRLGAVSPSMVEVLLGVSRQRVWTLMREGYLRHSGWNGFVLVCLKDVVQFARASNKRTKKRRSGRLATAAQ